jgi:hypothetical protein
MSMTGAFNLQHVSSSLRVYWLFYVLFILALKQFFIFPTRFICLYYDSQHIRRLFPQTESTAWGFLWSQTLRFSSGWNWHLDVLSKRDQQKLVSWKFTCYWALLRRWMLWTSITNRPFGTPPEFLPLGMESRLFLRKKSQTNNAVVVINNSYVPYQQKTVIFKPKI